MEQSIIPITIAIDFDGTCVTHEFPKVGRDIGAVRVLKKLIAHGHKLILYTMRSNCEGNTGASKEFPEVINGNFLNDAIDWFIANGIELHGIQTNPDQLSWTTSPKCYAQMYIDDAALGCPLKLDTEPLNTEEGYGEGIRIPIGRPYVDWPAVEIMLQEKGLIAPSAGDF